MAGDSQQVPDLQSILASLAQFSGTTASVAEPGIDLRTEGTPRNGTTGSEEHLQAPTLRPPEKAQDPRLRPQSRTATAFPKPLIDPASITTWQEALRCVTKIAAQNAQFAVSIQKMMEDQRKHEMRWYAERQSLKQTQATRSSSSAKALSILQSLNNGTLTAGSTDTQVDQAEELARFDRKIYAAQEAMEQAMTAEMKGLGVPFFGTDLNLVVPDGYDVGKEQLPESHPKWSPLVTDSELLALRRRMVQHLEDLYRD